jgi:hypothetical protein
MAGTRRTRKASGGKRKKNKANSTMSGGKRKASPWNKFVKKAFADLRRKDKNATFSDALKWASKHKSEM